MRQAQLTATAGMLAAPFRRVVLASVFLVFAVGCVVRPAAIAPSSSPLPAGTLGTERTTGTSCSYSLFGILPLHPGASTQRALRDAKQEVGAYALTDVTVDEVYNYFFILSRNCIYVEGLGVIH